jgi:hypothetical protein
MPQHTPRALPDILHAEQHSLNTTNTFNQLRTSLHKNNDKLRDNLTPNKKHELDTTTNFALTALIPTIDETQNEQTLQKLKPHLLELTRSITRPGHKTDNLRETLLTETLITIKVNRNSAHKMITTRERIPHSETVKLSRTKTKTSKTNTPKPPHKH